MGILGRNSPEWFMASVGASMAGGLGVGLYNSSTPEVISYIGRDAPFDVFCVEDAAELRRVMAGRSLGEALPTVEKVVLMAPGAEVPEEMAPDVITWAQLIELGRSESETPIKEVEKGQFANEAALLIYTSGTTGHPKGM